MAVSVGTGTSVGVSEGGGIVSVGVLNIVDETQEALNENNKILAIETRSCIDRMNFQFKFYPKSLGILP